MKGGIHLKEIKSHNFYEIAIRYENEIIAHTSCNFANGIVQIRDLYVLRDFRGRGLGEILLAQIVDFASDLHASQIIAYCGAEPFCRSGQIPLDQEIEWYEAHGFIHDHNVLGITPCMIKKLVQEVAV